MVHAFRKSDTLKTPAFDIRYLIMCIICTLVPFCVNAVEYDFATISLDNGLSQSTVRTTLRDSRGYLWIGTKGGLNRYDAGRMKTFWHEPENPESLPDNDILSVFEDDKGKVWVICEKGLAYYNTTTGAFHRPEVEGRNVNVRSYYKERDGVLFGGSGELYFFDYDTETLRPVHATGGSGRYYTSIRHWTQGRYVLATRWDGLWLYDVARKHIEPLKLCSLPDIRACLVDSNGNLWISPYGEGLLCFDRNGRQVFSAGVETLGSAIILDMLDADGKLWIATDGGGLYTLDLTTHRVTRVDRDDTAPSGLHSVLSLYRDPYGYIYAGTVRDGVTCISQTPMKTLSRLHGENTDVITSLCTQGDSLWVGIDGGGLALFEPGNEDNRLTRIASTAGMKITSIEDYDETHLILSTFDDGLYLFDKRSRALRRAPALFDPIVRDNARKALPLDLRRLPDNQLAVLSDRIYLCDLRRQTLTEHIGGGTPQRLNVFYSDMHNMLCFGPDEISRFDLTTNKTEKLLRLPGKNINCAAYDGERHIYIGTSTGLFRYDFETGEVAPVNANGAPLRINSLVFDSGRLWIGAEGAVYLYDIKGQSLARFGRYDGVRPNEFIYKSTLSTPSNVFMGGVNGLLKIDRQAVADFISHKKLVNPRVTDIEIDGNSLPVDKEKADVPHDNTSLALRVTGGDPHPLADNTFRFYINSPELSSPIETTDNILSLNNLKDGEKYRIYVSVKTHSGEWTKPRLIFTLNISSPWWKHPVALAVYAVVLCFILVIVFVYLQKRHRNNELKKLEEYRRRNLEKEVDFLSNINRELRTPLTLLYARVKMLVERMKATLNPDSSLLTELDDIYRTTEDMREIINQNVDKWGKEDIPVKDEPMMAVNEPADFDTSAFSALIATENNELAELMQISLMGMFGRVKVVTNGKDALMAIKNNHPDIIITDAWLPVMSGTELCRTLKISEEYNHIPVIMITSRIEQIGIDNGHDYGADAYITKPFDMEMLSIRCKGLLRSFDRVKRRYKSHAPELIFNTSKLNNEDESFLLKIKEIIEKNINSPQFGVDTVVDSMLMSRSALYSKFKQLTGQSLGSYISTYKIQRAKEMLTTTDMTMNEISDALGFSTQRYFSTFFKEKTGITPTAFRNSPDASIN